MNKRFLQLLQLSFIFFDFCSINIIFILSYYFFRQQNLIEQLPEYVSFNISLNVSWLISVLITNTYNKVDIISFETFTKITFRSYSYFILLIVIYLFFFKMMVLSRIFIFIVLAGSGVILLVTRFLYLGVYQFYKKKEWSLHKVLIIGYNNLSKKLVSHLNDSINVRVVGYCEEYENVKELSNYPILGSVNNAMQFCKEYGVHEIYSTIAPEHNRYLYELIESADRNCIRFKLVPDLGFFIKKQVHIDYLEEIPVVAIHNEPLQDIGNRIKKRFFDVTISSLVIVLILSWLLPLISFLIWIESRGGTFFLQHRNGRNNKTFTCIKFRSMYKNDAAHNRQATRNDERITRMGKFLRRTSFDELPQFINVLKGEMSIVGPRPHMLKHSDEYSKQIHEYMIRQFLKPGITGWAQVSGFRGETKTLQSMQKRIEHDIWYMENWSLLLDLKIMFLTIFNALRGDMNAF